MMKNNFGADILMAEHDDLSLDARFGLQSTLAKSSLFGYYLI